LLKVFRWNYNPFFFHFLKSLGAHVGAPCNHIFQTKQKRKITKQINPSIMQQTPLRDQRTP
jgi:hypothetical protein